jgi:hypothetical protein
MATGHLKQGGYLLFFLSENSCIYRGHARNPVVMVSPTVTVVGNGVLAPRVASFSSRGPSAEFPYILKV